MARILFIDDELPMAQAGKLFLERFGYRVTSFTDAEEAIALFQRQANDFNLVIVDLEMPGKSGLEVLQKLLRLQPDLRAILVTGFISESTRAEASRIGVAEVLLKPATPESLSATIRRVLTRG